MNFQQHKEVLCPHLIYHDVHHAIKPYFEFHGNSIYSSHHWWHFRESGPGLGPESWITTPNSRCIRQPTISLWDLIYCNWINFYNPDVIDRPAARDSVASKMMWMRNVKYAVSINLCLSLYQYWVVLALSQWTDLTQLRCGIFPPFVLHFLNWRRYLINIRIAFYYTYVNLGWTEKRTQDRRSIQLLVMPWHSLCFPKDDNQ